ncbi:hypothetical protein JTB14_002352 [Gonioctena quinquepunctata]|nr:hypothetical protein JTB14_002352 [Gonioctena quinquepunctata]
MTLPLKTIIGRGDDAESGCSSSSDEGDIEEESEDKINLPPKLVSLSQIPKGSVPESKPLDTIRDVKSRDETKPNLQSASTTKPASTAVTSTSTASSSRTVPASINAVPLMLPSSGDSSNWPQNMPPLALSSSSGGQVQAVPFLLQTPNGVGYASTPDGMILGILQGPNITQPQIVAIPIGSNELSGDSSDSCSEGEMDTEASQSNFAPPDTPSFTTISPSSSPFSQKSPSVTPAPTASPSSTKNSQNTTSAPSMLPPLIYQTPQGMMYATTPSSGGMILSLAQGDGSSSQPQFITIPLSMVASNGQGELDLSKRK